MSLLTALTISTCTPLNKTVLVLVLVELKESDRWCSQRIRKPTTKQTMKFHKHCEVMNDLGDDTDGEGESGNDSLWDDI